jgi:hypothetical protein
MSRVAKFVALLAAVGILVVLITPVPDELPCTAHRAPLALALSLNLISVLVQPIFPSPRSVSSTVQSLSGTDLLSFTCTLLC